MIRELPASPHQQDKLTVLIVDDSPEDRQTYRYFLGPEYRIEEAELGRQGLTRMREIKPDCILLDYGLPDINGLEVLAEISCDAQLHQAAVVLLTGLADTRVAVLAMKAGALDFLDKAEVNRTTLNRAVANAVEKIHLRQELELQREWLGVTLTCIHTGVVATDRAGCITVMNHTAASLIGWEPALALGQSVLEVLTLEDERPGADWRQSFARILGGEAVPALVGRAAWLMTREGRQCAVEYTLTPILCRSREVKGAVWAIQDVSARKLAEIQLLEAKRSAESANQAKSLFLANMSHELRTPLNAVLGFAQILQEEALAPDQREMVRHIHSGGLSLLNLINDILDFSKIDAGQLRIERLPFRLDSVLAQLASMLGARARNKGLDLRAEVAGECGHTLCGDPLRLGQILLNLAANAIKFTERGHVTLRVLPLSQSAAAVLLRFEISDSGIGMAPDVLPRLFTPFTQADSGITRRFGGSGLGLSICKQLVELMGGVIGVQSTLGVGSMFWFELPFKRVDDPRQDSAEAGQRPAGLPRLNGLHILVADDSQINRVLAQQALRREGAEATLVNDGRQALEALRTQPGHFDAVLMDIQMPVMDGISATRAIRAELGLHGLPVIALTAGVMDENKQAALEAGMNGFLTKPLTLEQLSDTLIRRVPARAAAG